ncbi:Hok/Gef family protein [Serratia marcescens]|uniref:Hok/Gef family protein n=2 Tax=Serratia marcescens TaxID=615 RepID=UPI00374E61C6
MMPNKRSLLKLVVICATVISLAWITRSTLCELRIRTVRQPGDGGYPPSAGCWRPDP